MLGKNRSSSSNAAGRHLVATVAVVALLIGSCMTVATIPAAADSTITDLDEKTPLTAKATYDRFEDQGVATADVAAPDLSITIAKAHEDVAVNGFYNDYSNEFIRVQYGESIDRTIRFYVPSSYFGAYYDESVESIAGDDAVAKLVPVAGGKYTAITLELDGKTDTTFAVSQLKGETWAFWSGQDAKLENATGISTGIAGTDQWNYASASDWTNGTLVVPDVADPSRLMVQYDADRGSDTEVWLKVPEGESSRADAYYFVRPPVDPEQNATVVVVSKTSDPPALRMKERASTRDGLGSIVSDWQQIPNRVGDFVDRIFGSGRK